MPWLTGQGHGLIFLSSAVTPLSLSGCADPSQARASLAAHCQHLLLEPPSHAAPKEAASEAPPHRQAISAQMILRETLLRRLCERHNGPLKNPARRQTKKDSASSKPRKTLELLWALERNTSQSGRGSSRKKNRMFNFCSAVLRIHGTTKLLKIMQCAPQMSKEFGISIS